MDHSLKTKKDYKIERNKRLKINKLNKLNKSCFQNVMAYREFKDLLTGTASHKILCDKALDIMDIQSQISWISKGSWFRSQLLFQVQTP